MKSNTPTKRGGRRENAGRPRMSNELKQPVSVSLTRSEVEQLDGMNEGGRSQAVSSLLRMRGKCVRIWSRDDAPALLGDPGEASFMVECPNTLLDLFNEVPHHKQPHPTLKGWAVLWLD